MSRQRQLEVREPPLRIILAAVDQAYRMLGSGRIDNPPRTEAVGFGGDPEAFRLVLTARLLDSSGRAVLTGTKEIVELGGQDHGGARALGRRIATLTLRHEPTGEQVVLDADALTDQRTGAAAAWALQYLGVRPRRLAVIGTGRVAAQAARCAAELLQPEVIVATSRTAARREAFSARLRPELGDRLRVVETVDQALAGADAVIAAVPAAEPVLTTENTAGLAGIVAVEGDPRAVLLAPRLLLGKSLVADDPVQAARSGSLLGAAAAGVTPRWVELPDRVATLSDLALGRAAGDGLVLLTGLAALDLILGAAVWRLAGGPVV